HRINGHDGGARLCRAYACEGFGNARQRSVCPLQRGGDCRGHRRRIELAGRGQQRVAVGVALAGDVRALREWIKQLDELILDDRALLFDYEDLVETLCEGERTPRLERPAHADFVEADAELLRLRLVEAEVVQR